MSELVREIVEVNAYIGGDEEKALLTVEAEGITPTAGWTNLQLDPHVYINPPADGVQDFDLVGDRPSGGGGDTPTTVEAAWEGPLEDWVIGIRVHAIANMIEDEIFEPWEEEDDEDEAEEQSSKAA